MTPLPRWIAPQLCRLVTKIPAGDAWAHEIKFDGFRLHARILGSQASLLTRNRLDWTEKYPQIASALGALKCRQAYLDGELCAVQKDGATPFSALQGHRETPANLAYFAFELLHLDGNDLSGLPLLERKAGLKTLLKDAPTGVRLSEHIVGNGACSRRHRNSGLKGSSQSRSHRHAARNAERRGPARGPLPRRPTGAEGRGGAKGRE